LKLQKKEDSIVTADIQGREINEPPAHADEPRGIAGIPQQPAQEAPPTTGVGLGAEMRMEFGPYTSYVDVALALTRQGTLNMQHVVIERA
jgi:hypothetical protein